MDRISAICNQIQFGLVDLGFKVPPTAKVIKRRDFGLKTCPIDWRSTGSKRRALAYMVTLHDITAPRRLFTSCLFQVTLEEHS